MYSVVAAPILLRHTKGGRAMRRCRSLTRLVQAWDVLRLDVNCDTTAASD